MLHPCRPRHLKIYCQRKACQWPLISVTEETALSTKGVEHVTSWDWTSNKSPVILVSGYRLAPLDFHRLNPNLRAPELPSLNSNIIAGPKYTRGEPTAERLLQRTLDPQNIHSWRLTQESFIPIYQRNSIYTEYRTLWSNTRSDHCRLGNLIDSDVQTMKNFNSRMWYLAYFPKVYKTCDSKSWNEVRLSSHHTCIIRYEYDEWRRLSNADGN